MAKQRHRPEALDEVTEPPTDPVREAKRRDLDDPADVPIDPEMLRRGGPVRAERAIRVTGGRPEPEPVRRRTNRDRGEKVAPTTTGDATSGGMNTPGGGATSDATTAATSAGDFRDR